MSQFASISNLDFLKSYSVAPYIEALQLKCPLIHCITNTVVQNFTANLLLSVGASPAMVEAEEEVVDFVPISDGVLINLGTVTKASAKSMLLAAKTAQISQTPWVLDLVAINPVLPFRTELAKQLIGFQPTVIRCNASEILVLDQKLSKSKGVDSHDDINDAMVSADSVASKYNCIVVLTGEVDYITDGQKGLLVIGGNSALTRVTGTGCALSALVAAFIGSHNDHLAAAASACALMAKASEQAILDKGLGGFAVSLLDNLSQPLALFKSSKEF